jgi:signal transduction histidine kinase
VDETLGRLPPDLETTLYRFVQEALTNVSKHARAERVWVSVRTEGGGVGVSVRDDGVGYVPDPNHGGFGIAGMRERLAMAGGTLDITSSAGAGSTFSTSLPVAADQVSSMP